MKFELENFHELSDNDFKAVIRVDRECLGKIMKVWIESMNDNIDQDLYWAARAAGEKKAGELE